jgi:hypothetical protein
MSIGVAQFGDQAALPRAGNQAMGQAPGSTGAGHDLGREVSGPGQQLAARQDLVDDAQALGLLGGDSLAGVDDVAGAPDAGHFPEDKEHAVAGDGAGAEVAVAEHDVRRAHGQVAQQRKLQPRARAVDHPDGGNVDVEDKPFEEPDAVVVLLVDEVAVPRGGGPGE